MAVNLPPLNLASTSSAYAGPMTTTSMFDASGFSVNYGNGVSQGAGGAASIPNWVWVAAAAVGALFWKQIKKSV